MNRYVAFLRGMNLGSRRIRNDELCAHFSRLGFPGAVAFLASGNVIFEARRSRPETLARRLEAGLGRRLGYEVATFVRTAEQVRQIAAFEPFGPEPGGGKPQVVLLPGEPSAEARSSVLELATTDDRLAFDRCELHWLPSGNMSSSTLDLARIEAGVGPTTIRTKRTIERIAAGYLGD